MNEDRGSEHREDSSFFRPIGPFVFRVRQISSHAVLDRDTDHTDDMTRKKELKYHLPNEACLDPWDYGSQNTNDLLGHDSILYCHVPPVRAWLGLAPCQRGIVNKEIFPLRKEEQAQEIRRRNLLLQTFQ